jgi:hypothetical protein
MKAARLYHTLRRLKPQQWFYRGWYPIKKRLYAAPVELTIPVNQARVFGNRKFYALKQDSCYNPGEHSFRFLNISHSFGGEIDWDFSKYGRLWTYNLNYFNWLTDESLSSEQRLETIYSYIRQKRDTGSEPYPISLRGIQWIKFLSGQNIFEPSILEQLYRDYNLLSAFPEYHIQANHLLENGFSLFFAAHFFNDQDLYEQAHRILVKELEEQILGDGGHYEQSPMYHCILLQRLMECIEMLRLSERFPDEQIAQLMERKAGKMLGWLHAFCFADCSYAMTGDAAPGVAADVRTLLAYAMHLQIGATKSELKESGYRKLCGQSYELLADVGNILPAYQPGHAHADTFSFCLNVKGKPVIVDTGISTYEKNDRRLAERGTEAHNTINVAGINSSDVWDGFRMGKRASVNILNDTGRELRASHDGYAAIGIIHERHYKCEDKKIIIGDRLKGYKGQGAWFHIHFHPSCKPVQRGPLCFETDGIIINIIKGTGAELVNYLYCSGYNKTEPGVRLRIHVEEHAVVSIEL